MRPGTTSQTNDELTALCSALDDYELADARLEWARICHCELGAEQRDALEWHTTERTQAHEALMCALERLAHPPLSA